jgi:predicted MFS family arabinose efflux permease
MVLSMLTLLVAMAVYAVVPKKRAGGSGERLSSQILGVKAVFTSYEFWHVAPLTTLSQASFLSIQGLWAGPWLKDVAGLNRTAVASHLFWVAVAMIVGFIALGALAERLNRSGVAVLTTAATGMGLFMGIQLLMLLLPLKGSRLLWMLFGFFGTSGIVAYAGLSQRFATHLSGRVTTAINLLVFVVAFGGQWAVGAIIECWPEGSDGNYALPGYYTGFSVLLALQFISLAWFLFGDWIMGKMNHS